jgi:hypothetical protein
MSTIYINGEVFEINSSNTISIKGNKVTVDGKVICTT